MSAPRPRVVIVGAGFAGLAAAKALRQAPVQVTVLDQHDYHTFTPFLYQVATALLETDAAAHPVRGEFRQLRNVSFRLANVTGVDLEAKAVETDQGRVPYDYLVLAAGAVNAYFGHSEIAGHSLGLNDLPEALQLRNASVFRRPLPAAADRALRRKGIRVRSGVMVAEVDEKGLRLKDGTTVPAATVVWAAGVRASHLADGLGPRLGSHARVAVTPTLQVAGHPEVFAVGDFAEIPQPDKGRPLPMLAQVGIQSGRQAAKNIAALLRAETPQPLRYKDLGTMAMVGRGFAVADIGPVRLSGRLGFLAWLLVHIARIAGMRTRWLVLANWVSGFLFRNRPVRLIARPREAEHKQLQDHA